MLQSRVIPILLLKKRGLYKGTRFKNHKYIGDPINTIKIFNDKEVDEIIILDIENRNEPDFEYLKKLTKEAFMPMCYGGNIHTIEDAKQLFYIGFEKISINSLFYSNINLVYEIIKAFGSQSVVLSVDVRKNFLGKYKVFSFKGKKKEKESLEDVLLKIKDLEVGEILLTNMDNESSLNGYDLELIKLVKKYTMVPLIIHGGAGNMEHLITARKCGADAFGCGSKFIFYGPHRAVLITYESFYNK